jgi:hypothetical protein
MTDDMPSPDEAAHELSEISDRRQRAAVNAARKPDRVWWAVATGMVLSGFAADRWPSLGFVPGLVFAALTVLLVLSIRSKRIAAAMGYRAAADRQSMPRKAVDGKYLMLIAVLALALLMAVGLPTLKLPFTHTIGAVIMAGVVLLVLRPAVRSVLTTVPPNS